VVTLNANARLSNANVSKLDHLNPKHWAWLKRMQFKAVNVRALSGLPEAHRELQATAHVCTLNIILVHKFLVQVM